MTRDEIVAKHTQIGIGREMLAFHQLQRAQASGPLGATHAGKWMVEQAAEIESWVRQIVEETFVGMQQAAREAAKAIPAEAEQKAGVLSMNGQQPKRTTA